MGRIAYCAAMPKLSGATNIRDFIACVTYAMALDILPGNEGTRLLYAAQVAHMALTKRPKKRNKSSHTSTTIATQPLKNQRYSRHFGVKLWYTPRVLSHL